MKTYIYLNSDQTCDVYITEGTHDHSIIQTDRGMSPEIREEIERLYDSGITKPKKIADNLNKKKHECQNEPIKKFPCSTSNPAFRCMFNQPQRDGWYEGYATGIPSPNNALESVSKTVKYEHSFGSRMAVGEFFELVKCHIVHNWSSDRNPDDINAKIYASEPIYTLKDQTAAYQWIQAKKKVQIQQVKQRHKIELYFNQH